ncbi:anti-sigma factor family protein [Compostimonas suwonensis]|uniref:Putative zinc finger protein n=1 Tax=Compostimonas suwonensis TaxID=1048394 RepID=A0A2M9C576_9MICO|nr:zf-HC2 domain-containing protein [Compostimonas suwonensis]PJJ65662.1 putative zinc finger protein [Compostimonas suwonensis]
MTDDRMTDDRDPFRDWDAAYVLGALSPDDRRAFERHLATCPACSAAVAELAGMPGLLGTLSEREALAILAEPSEHDEHDEHDGQLRDEHLRDGQHEPGLVQRLAASATRSRRRLRRRLIAAASAAAAVLLLGGIVVGTSLGTSRVEVADPPATSGTSDVAPVVAMTPVKPGIMTAELQLTSKAWGTRLDWSCEYLKTWDDEGGDRPAPSYDMVVTDAAGTQTTVASWSAAGSEATGLTASSSVPTGDIRSVEIRLGGSETPLVRTEL